MLNYLTTVVAALCLTAAILHPAVIDAQITVPLPPRNETNICTGHPLNAMLPDFNDCTRFFRCGANGPTSSICGGVMRFNATTGMCSSAPVNCFQCPADQYFIDVPVDYNCLQFIRCFAGRAQQHTCAEGLLFDPVRRQCNFERQVTCPCPREDLPTRPLFVRNWAACNQYHVCVNGSSINGTCPNGLNFNVRNQQCDFPNVINCLGPSTNGF